MLPLLYLPRPLDQRLRARVDRVPRLRGRAVGADDHPAHHGSGEEEARSFNQRSLAGIDYVYVWVDGIHLKVRLSQDKVCLLVMIGVRADGTKELIALADGHRESTESWADLLRDCRRRGMRAPVLAAGDGALGFWVALREVFAGTREQRCWFHKIVNVRNAPPKSTQPGAKAALAEIWGAEDREHAEQAARSFATEYGVKWAKAAAKITEDLDVLLAFYDYPGRALGPLAHHEPDRVDIRDRPAAPARHRGTRLEGCRHRDGVQAHRVSPSPMAGGQRTPPRATRPSRSNLQQGQTRRTRHQEQRRGRSRLKEPHPQVLTITQSTI